MAIKKMEFCLKIMCLLFLALPTSCFSSESLLTGGPHYFKSFAGYTIPYRPISPIKEDDAKSLQTYYIAFYNDNGQITEFSKYFKGKLVFKDVYTYDDMGKLHKRILTNTATKKETIGFFDENGKLRQ